MATEKTVPSAILSACGAYRYSLSRVWRPEDWLSGSQGCFVMLNPSTADHEVDDPTIRRVVGYARAWGWSGVTVVNLFALRATKPEALLGAPDPVGPHNDDYLRALREHCALVVCAWGEPRQSRLQALVAPRAQAVAQLLGAPLYALATTKSGQPRHPLYLRSDLTLRPWPGAS